MAPEFTTPQPMHPYPPQRTKPTTQIWRAASTPTADTPCVLEFYQALGFSGFVLTHPPIPSSPFEKPAGKLRPGGFPPKSK